MEIKVAIINGIFAISGIIVGFLSNFIYFRLKIKNIKLMNERLKYENDQLLKKNQQLSFVSNKIIPANLNQYLLDLMSDLNTWRGILGSNRKIELDTIYINIELKNISDDRQNIRDFDLLNILMAENNKNKNILIKGDAGSGKSTLIRKWACEIAQNYLLKKSIYGILHFPVYTFQNYDHKKS